ncbi:MAG: zf-HC2 domain-containing protein [Polyangiaceae bacterium]
MDCEKFDQNVIDALYDELDELTMASMKRHMETCSRCASAFSALRATREVAILPLEEPSDELESRILFAASAAQRTTPWHKKALRGLAWAGSHAMRPQLAMAAVFVLVIGSSLLFLRAKPGTTSLIPVRVTERGEPTPERDEGAEAAMEAPAAAASAAPEPQAQTVAAGDGIGSRAADAKDDQDGHAEAEKGKNSAQVALDDARSTEGLQGCDAALSKYDDVGVRFAGTSQAAEAMWSAAACHKKRGDAERARELYGALAKRDEYKDKAEEALNELAPIQNNAAASAAPAATATVAAAKAAATSTSSQAPGGGARAGANAAPAAAPKAAAPAKPAPAPPSGEGYNTRVPGSTGKENASPQRRAVSSDSAL